MSKRKIIEIDRELCNGCGLCTSACAEGALVLDEENKARLVGEIYCDGLGACLDVCPTGALRIGEREGEDYNPQEAFRHVLKTRGREAAGHVHGIALEPGTSGCASGGCPGARAQEISQPSARLFTEEVNVSELTQWPVQLHLVSPHTPHFLEADLLVAADCTAYAAGSFHTDLLRGRKLVIACPKLDETGGYVDKLAELFRFNKPRSLTVAVMTVPCCRGLLHMVERAVRESGERLSVRTITVDIDGRTSTGNPASLFP